MELAAEPGLSPKRLDSISELVPSEHMARERRGTDETGLGTRTHPLTPSYPGPVSLWRDAATSSHLSGEVFPTMKG